ncbi:MAG: hypothetical protein ACFCVE_00140, partial [Phycisphaerae bacterium]
MAGVYLAEAARLWPSVRGVAFAGVADDAAVIGWMVEAFVAAHIAGAEEVRPGKSAVQPVAPEP